MTRDLIGTAISVGFVLMLICEGIIIMGWVR